MERQIGGNRNRHADGNRNKKRKTPIDKEKQRD